VLGLGYDPAPGAAPFSLQYVLLSGHLGRRELGSVVFILGLGARHLNFNSRALAYGNEAVLPFYVFHQTIILMVGYYIIRWPIAAPLKFVIIAVLSFAAIMALYELFVRRFNAMRFLFGMRPLRRSG